MDPSAFSVCQNIAEMDGLRLVLLIGLLGMVVILLLELVQFIRRSEAETRRRAGTVEPPCPLHKVRPLECEDKHKDPGSPTAEPPNDDE